MSQYKEAVSLGEVVRYMARQALNSERRKFHVPINLIARQVYGLTADDMGRITSEDLEADGKYTLSKFKASYVANTVARMPEIQSANVRAKLSIKDGDFGNDVDVRCAYITLVDGAINKGKRVKDNNHIADKAIIDFKSRLLRLSPSVAGLQGDELNGALSMINAYQELIKEAK